MTSVVTEHSSRGTTKQSVGQIYNCHLQLIHGIYVILPLFISCVSRRFCRYRFSSFRGESSFLKIITRRCVVSSFWYRSIYKLCQRTGVRVPECPFLSGWEGASDSDSPWSVHVGLTVWRGELPGQKQAPADLCGCGRGQKSWPRTDRSVTVTASSCPGLWSDTVSIYRLGLLLLPLLLVFRITVNLMCCLCFPCHCGR